MPPSAASSQPSDTTPAATPAGPPAAALLSTAAALAAMLGAARALAEAEVVDTLAAQGRVLAAPVTSPIDVPPMATSARDGYAVRVADFARLAAPPPGGPAGAAQGPALASQGLVLPVSQRIPAGHAAPALAGGTVARIFTGAMVPLGADAIVMQEEVQADPAGVRFSTAPAAGAWITRQGADIAAGAVILPAGHRLDAQSLGLAASVGCATLPVVRRLKVAVLFTGDELTPPGQPLRPGAIYNSNRYTLRALLEKLGCTVSDFGIVPDTLAATRDTLQAAARDHDVVLTSGGVSVGEEDHVKPAVKALGRLDLWQIALKPGKPLAFGELDRPGAAPAFFIGLPGNPVSSFVTFLLFVRPFLLRLSGVPDVAPRAVSVRADFTQPKADRRNEFLRARFNEAGGLTLFPDQSPAVLTSTVWGDGLIDNPPGHAIQAGEWVRFLPFAELLN
jgi:molybdopterin molybdotransferase